VRSAALTHRCRNSLTPMVSRSSSSRCTTGSLRRSSSCCHRNWTAAREAGGFLLQGARATAHCRSAAGRVGGLARGQGETSAMEVVMAEGVYKIVEVVGVSENSWEEAGRNAVETAAGSLRDLRVAEVTKIDMTVKDGKVAAFRTRVSLSFKYEA